MKNLAQKLRNLIPMHVSSDEIYVVCIGTDRSTGDCFGPLVGTLLQRRGVKNVIGTMEKPLHATDLEERLDKEVPAGAFTIAIDACLGKSTSIGKIIVNDGPIRPGAGVGKHLPPVGDVSIDAIVNVGGYMEYFVLQNTRLHLVMNLAEKTARAVKKALANRTILAEVAAGKE